MARRSSSSRWSRPATGKQIAALKSHGNYDGKYYSMGRASRAIGGSGKGASSGRRSSGGGSPYSPLAGPSLGSSSVLSRFFGGDGLDSLLQPALGPALQSPLVASGSGPTSFLSELLGVPDDLDALVRAAMDGAQSDATTSAEDDRVESVLYTVRSDDSMPAEPRIVVEAEVVHDSAFEGQPNLQVRFVSHTEPDGVPSSDRSRQPGGRSTLGYRPSWTPTLVRTPADLAEQMRVRWREAMDELRHGVDPRMSTFLAGFSGMESALAVLTSSQSSASKYVLLQGLMDPDGTLQFQGLGLDAGTFAAQIRAASAGDEDALSWLEEIRREQVLTSLAEVTGSDLAAEADFRLSRWHNQGTSLIEAVTINAQEADFDFSMIRSLLTMKADTHARREELRAKIAERRASSSDEAISGAYTSILDSLESDDSSEDSGGYGLLEDWFFEETRDYLQFRLRRSLPGQFAAALVAVSPDGDGLAALAAEVRKLAQESSVNPKDYSEKPDSGVASGLGRFARLYGDSSRRDARTDRIGRIVQAVRHVVVDLEAAEKDDLGTLVVAQEVLTYAQWKRDELLAEKQLQAVEEQKFAARERASMAQQRSIEAAQRAAEASKVRGVARDVEQIVGQYAEALTRTTGSVAIQDPLPDSSESLVDGRIEQAKAREVAAAEWLAAAEERERWAAAEALRAATPTINERLLQERDAAAAEQSEAKAERQAASAELQEAADDETFVSDARSRFDDLIRPVREENRRRAEAEAERRRQQMARQEEERRQRAEAQRKQQAAERERQDAANQRQEEANQRQMERARLAKDALAPELERLLSLPDSASIWRRKTVAATRASLEQKISRLQAEIAAPLVPPRTRSKAWPNLLSTSERYLGTVKKLTDYGAFVSLPAGADGLLRMSDARTAFTAGQLVIVEISDMPYGKPIVLRLVSR